MIPTSPRLADRRAEDALPAMRAVAAVASPRGPRRAALGLVAALLLAASAMAGLPWQQVAVGKGRVVAYAPLDRQQAIEAPIEGRVVRWHVREGSVVKRGEPIADLADNDPALLTRLQQERAALEGRLAAVRERQAALADRAAALGASRRQAVAAASARARMAAQRVTAAEQAVAAAGAAQETARLNRDRQRALARQGLAAQRALELAELEHTRAATERARAGATLAAASSEQGALEADAARAATDGQAAVVDARASAAAAEAEQAAIAAELARLAVRLARQAAQAVTAPRDGVVLRLTAGEDGEMVKPGDPLALLVPDTEDRAVELWLKGNDVPLVAAGRPVRLQFEGWPALQFVGWPSVAVGTFGGTVALVDATDDGTGRFRVLVVPDGQQAWPEARFLRQGVRANGWVILNQVPLGFEIWRQFNGFPPAVPLEEAPEAKAKAPSERLKP